MNVRWWGCKGNGRAVGIGQWLCLWCFVLCGLSLLTAPTPVQAASEVKVAIIVPLSGRWARQGELLKAGARDGRRRNQCPGWYQGPRRRQNGAGPGGCRGFRTKSHQCGAAGVEAGNISAAQGAWLSSFTLGATEVSERLGIPWLTLSWSDKITERGFSICLPVVSGVEPIGRIGVSASRGARQRPQCGGKTRRPCGR